MKIVTLDFETFWAVGHSLTKMAPTEYVMHPDTEIISCAIKIGDRPTRVYFGEEIGPALHDIDWSDVLCVGHNLSGFDSMIVRWRYGIQPKMWGCTMAMARPFFAKTIGLSLGALVEHFGLGVKNNAVLLQTKGRHLVDFTKAEIAGMRKYNADDTDQCYALFKILAKMTQSRELLQIHLLTEKLVNPQFELDFAMLEQTLEDVVTEHRRMLLEIAGILGVTIDALPQYKQTVRLLGSDVKGGKNAIALSSAGDTYSLANEDMIIEAVRKVLSSAPKFCALLNHLGVDVPMKESKTQKQGEPTKFIPALSKADEGFLALLEHDNPMVASAAEARLATKSTLLQTRIGKFLRAGRACGGKLPVPMRYYGADTTGRDSGEQYNMLNLPRIIPGQPKLSDSLRMSLCAPKGHKVVVADLSGIELRVNHFLWKVPYSMKMWKDDPEADLYKAAACVLYGITLDEVNKLQRQMEKVKALGLGFGAGWSTFQQVAKLMSGGQLVLDDAQAEEAVTSWRNTHKEIVTGWRTCHNALVHICDGREVAIDPWGMCHTSKEGIVLPSNRVIRYPDLREEVNDKTGRSEWVYGHGRHKARIYAGKIDENIVQAISRDIMVEAEAEMYKNTGFASALRVYDELAYVVPEQKAVDLLEAVQTLFRTPPKWWPELVTWSEGDIGDRYGEAK